MRTEALKPEELGKLIALEQELQDLKEEYGITQKPCLWRRLGDWYCRRTEARVPRRVNRKHYLFWGLFTGWAGGHRFYAGQKILGIIYLLLCWTGIPFTMTIIDLMIALPKTPDEDGMILL